MGFRFQRRIPLLGNLIRLNLSGSRRGPTAGISVGIPGARTSVNSRGDRVTSIGILGTGLRHVTQGKVVRGPWKRSSRPHAGKPVTVARLGKVYAIAAVIGYAVVRLFFGI